VTSDYYVQFTPEMKEEYTILVPSMLNGHFELVIEFLGTYGYKMELLTGQGKEIVDLGLRYVHNDTCYPAILVHGRFSPSHGTLTGSVKRSEDSFMRRVISPDGKEAVTLYREIAYSSDANVSLVYFELLTGRTHQIRLHCLWHAHPLVGDTMYGLQQLKQITAEQDYVRPDLLPEALVLCRPEQMIPDNMVNRHALHASHLEFEHVASRQTITINADLTPDLNNLFKQLNIATAINCN
jgi:hypothetical protein